MKKILKRTLAVLLSATMVFGAMIQAGAVERVVETYSGDMVEKISNPDRSEREVDGLIDDRETGYLWALAERGDYLYIGTWRNTVGAVIQIFLESAIVASGTMDSETVWGLTDIITNGEVPHPTSYSDTVGANGGVIVKVPKDNPEDYEIIFESADPFRHVINYGDDLYFATYVGPTGNDASIYKVDEDDNVTKVYSTKQGASMRANAVFNGHLYFAGTKADEAQATGEPTQLAVLEKNDDNDEWNVVADWTDFGSYAYDPYVSAIAGSPFWDMIGYNDELYVTLPGVKGFVIFKGHEAQDGEEANDYGWVWTEVVGSKNGINNQGMADKAEGYDLIGEGSLTAGYLSVIASLAVYNDQLYVYDIDHTIVAELRGVQGGLALMSALQSGADYSASQYLEPMLATIEHPQRLFVMDDDTGELNEVTGFTELMEGTTNEYLWKHGIYNGEMYISTMDSKVIYNYITRLTNGNFISMTKEEWAEELGYVLALIKHLVEVKNSASDETEELIEPLTEQLENLSDMMSDIDSLDMSDTDKVEDYYNEYVGTNDDASEVLGDLEGDVTDDLTGDIADDTDVSDDIDISELDSETQELIIELQLLIKMSKDNSTSLKDLTAKIKEAIQKLQSKITEIYNKIDWAGIKMYLKINEYVVNDVQGFDIVKTSDGVNWEVVTDDGFGDKYNYGGLRFVTTDNGMYITTANPFYGGQLYLLTNDLGNPTVDSVTITPESATVANGKQETFTATVEGENNPSQEVTWSIMDNESEDTSIDENGVLTVADDETADEIEVFATSVEDPTVFKVAKVTIEHNFLIGDVDLNGLITIRDAALIQKSLVGQKTLSKLQTILADVDGNGYVSIVDATVLQKQIVEVQ